MTNSLVVLNYNDLKTTINLIENIKEYDQINNIIVVDNKSTDNSYEILKNYESEKIRVIQTDCNKGYAVGNNYGIKFVMENFKSDFITVANPDIYFTNDTLKEMKKFLVNNENIASVNTRIYMPNNKEQIASWNLPTLKEDFLDMFLFIKKLRKKNRVKLQKVDFNEVLAGCFFMIKSNVMKEIDLFDERTFLYGEERILAHKIKSIGMKQATLNYEKCIHEHSKSINKNISSIIDKYNILYESREVYYRHYAKINKIELICFKILRNISLLEKILLRIIKNKK